MRMIRVVVPAIVMSIFGLGAPAQAEPRQQLTDDDYVRAERFLPWNASTQVLNGAGGHHWIGTEDRFWYLQQGRHDKQFLIIDAKAGQRRPAFDHAAVAVALAQAMGTTVDPSKLPFDSFEFVAPGNAILMSAAGKRWRCTLGDKCIEAAPETARPDELRSPDGQWAAFLKGNDMWVRSLHTGTEKALSTDGQPEYAYGLPAGSSLGVVSYRRTGQPIPPIAIWSADSTRLLTHRLDERQVADLYYLQYAPEDGSARPKLHRTRFAMPGDKEMPGVELVVFDVAAETRTDMKLPPLPVTTWTPIEESRAWWGADDKTVYVLPREVGQKRLQLYAMDVATGATKLLMEERAITSYIEAGARATRTPDIRVLKSGEIIWYSERNDWGHLYLYSRDGKLIRQLTSGDWKVMGVVRIDEQAGRLYFVASGRERGEDPYQRHLYVVNLDGSGLRLLTPENADHGLAISAAGYYDRFGSTLEQEEKAGFSPSGRYFIETYSRPDSPPQTVLRRKDGKLVTVVSAADISQLEEGGFSRPEPFSVRAADGVTLIYGNLLRPSRFDPQRKYPVIDAIYPGPQGIRTQKTFMDAVFDWNYAQSLAELGFIVVTIDGRGTPFRSKSFHDASYSKMQDAGNLDDHIAGLRQLAAERPFMDLERVGIYGHSGGGYAAARAILLYPDFYTVAVASAGNHDQAGYTLMWGPTFQGPYGEPQWNEQRNTALAARLRGKLLLIHGDMDDNVHPAMTMQLVAALVRENKTFDFLLLPNANHEISGSERYFARLHWDYFVRHLMGAEPPPDYRIAGPQGTR